MQRIKYILNEKTSKSALLSASMKPIGMILSILYTPMLLGYLGDEKYGIWSTILSMITWINYADIGVGQGLRNILTKFLAKEEYGNAKRSIRTSLTVLIIISVILIFTIHIITQFVGWGKVLGTDIDINLCCEISFIWVGLNFVLALSNTILYSLQKAEIVAIKNCLIQLANILILLLIRKRVNDSLVALAIMFGATTAIVHVFSIIYIREKKPQISISSLEIDPNYVKEIWGLGIKFFIIQFSCLLLHTVDNILITRYFGAAEVTPFNIVNKVFNTGYSVLLAFLAPYWSRMTVAVTKNDFKWMKVYIKRLNLIGIVFSALCFLVAVVCKPICNLWLGKELNYPERLMLVMAIYYGLYSFVTINTQLINGTGKINFQLVVMLCMGIINIPLSIILGVNCGMGVVGIRVATTRLMGIGAIAFPINLLKIIKEYKKGYIPS